MNYLAIFIGGGLGSLLRYLTTTFFKRYSFYDLPFGTLISNILASILLGLFIGYFATKSVNNKHLVNLLIIGLCGGFSTFSTFALENYKYIETSQYAIALFYILLSIILGLFAIYFGFLVSHQIFKA